jgi:hypothetical protein
MTPEAIIQKAYAELMKDEALPFFDIMPSREQLPIVLLRSVQTTYQGRKGAECITEFSIIFPGTSKKELYSLAENVLKIIGKVVDYQRHFGLENHKVLTTMATNYANSDRPNSSPEIWQMYNIQTRITLTNCRNVD